MAESQAPYIRVVVASRDRRFLNLARFLLSRRGILVTRTCPLGVGLGAASHTGADVVVLDTDGSAASTRRAEELAERRPSLGVVVVADGLRGAARSRSIGKWSLDEVAAAIEQEHARARRSLVPPQRIHKGTAVHG